MTKNKQINASNHDAGGEPITVTRPTNQVASTVKVLRQCGYRTVTVNNAPITILGLPIEDRGDTFESLLDDSDGQ